MQEEPHTKKQEEREYLLLGVRIAADFGATIAIPAVFAALLGQWLDHRFGTLPWATVGACALAALFSGMSIYRKAKMYGKRYSMIDKEKTKKNV